MVRCCQFWAAARAARWPVGLIGLVVLMAAAARAAAPWEEHLAAGEFGPAKALALKSGDRATVDAALDQVARAQAAAGARDAALASAASLSDDRRRAELLQTLAVQPAGAAGGQQADFDALINLITSTIAPTTWDDVGGPGAIQEFAGGVYVDAAGQVRPLLREEVSRRLAEIRFAAHSARPAPRLARDSSLRKVSLTRLERQVQLRLAQGKRPSDEMQRLAGLQRIQYLLVYPESGDLVLAGPAGPWRADGEGRAVSTTTGRPVVQLDDLVAIFRHLAQPESHFGCSIVPRTEALAEARQFLEASSRAPLKPGQRDRWLGDLRAKLGRQQIEVYGLDPRSRAARVLVEADYRMKLVGMGLEEGTLGVTSYLDSIEVGPGQAPPPLGVLRWWFALRYQALRTTAERNAFELVGQGVQVLSENEHLTALGQRVPTGESEPLNRQFAESFTRHFEALARKYPVYADLQNLFDLALVAAVVHSEDLASAVGWFPTCFGPQGNYQGALGTAPTEVETVINHRQIDARLFVAGVSGGVRVDPWATVRQVTAARTGSGGLAERRTAAGPKAAQPDAWWWD